MAPTSSQRLSFLALHLGDLQSIRFAPLPLAMMAAALAVGRMPQFNREMAWTALLGFLLMAIGFYRWTTVELRQRYGRVRTSREEKLRMSRHPAIAAIHAALLAALLWCGFYAPNTHFGDVYVAGVVLLEMGSVILDRTNVASRRAAWGGGLGVLFAGTPFLLTADTGRGALALLGAVWLSLSVFDFLLLRRIFAETPHGQG